MAEVTEKDDGGSATVTQQQVHEECYKDLNVRISK